MTMPNPVAEVVERLRAEAERVVHRNDDGSTIGVTDPLKLEAADLLERLSRERDTGVPEGFWLAPNDPDQTMIRAAIKLGGVDASDPDVGYSQIYNAFRAAAPQPPTVSTQGDAQCQSQVPLKVRLKCILASDYMVELAQEALARIEQLERQAEGLCDGCGKPLEDAFCVRCKNEQTATLTRERDQAREALDKYEAAISEAEAILGGEYALTEGVFFDLVQEARSVLHPEKEEKA